MTTLVITGFYAALLAFLIVVLALRVVRLRAKYKVGFLDGGHAELTKAIRIHGNATETVPMTLLLMACAEIAGLTPIALHTAGILFLGARIYHAMGLNKSSGRSNGRTFGMLLTIAVILALGAFNLLTFMKSQLL